MSPLHSLSPVVVLIEFHFPILLHRVGLIHVKGKVGASWGQRSREILRFVDRLAPLFREIGRWLSQIALAHR